MREGPVTVAGGRQTLPTALKPTHYNLFFTPDFEHASEFAGSALIDVVVMERTQTVALNASPEMKIEKVEVVVNGDKVEVVSTGYDAEAEVLSWKLERWLEEGDEVLFGVGFKGTHKHLNHGFYRSPYVGKKGEQKWMFSTHMEPTDARQVFPCFDEPALKATFSISIIADEEYQCFSNMPISSSTSLPRSKTLTTFLPTPIMSTYLVCFAVGKLNTLTNTTFRIPIRIIATPDKNIEHGRRAAEIAARSLEAFEKVFDLKFPLPKMDLIAISSGQGAMENWGLVTFNENLLLIDEKESSAEAWRMGAKVIVHELAHQWFGNIVTMDFWDGLWLNESFADWATFHVFQILEPTWDMWSEFTSGAYQLGLQFDANRASHPIEVHVGKGSEINQIFDEISYNKGCAVLRMISSFLGVEVFIKGVQQYLKKYSYGNSITANLWESLSGASGIDVGNIMAVWTKEVGFPVISVSEHARSSTVTLTQHRFLIDGTSTTSDDKTLYPVSLGLLTEEGVDNEITLYERSRTLDVDLGFYKLNSDTTGFYRVSYPPERLQILGENAKDGLLPPSDRLGLIADALAMASSGYRGAKTSAVLELFELFVAEDDYFVWKSLLSSLEKIKEAWMFDAEVLPFLNSFQNHLIREILRIKGWNFSAKDGNVETLFKALIFDHATDIPLVRNAARELFEKWKSGDKTAVDVNILGAVFASALEHGEIEDYEAVFAAIQTSISIDQRDICLYAIGKAQDPSLIARTLEFALLHESIAHNDLPKIIVSLTTHTAGTIALWEFLKGNYDEIRTVLGNGLGAFARLLQRAMASLGTKEQLADARRFFEGKDTEGFDVYLARSLNAIEVKTKWVERDGDDVKEWLKGHGYDRVDKSRGSTIPQFFMV